MDEDKQSPFDLRRLSAIFARSFVLTIARILIMSWYVYFGLHFSEKLEAGGGYMYLVMFPLSIFGLWQLLEWLAKITGLRETGNKVSESE